MRPLLVDALAGLCGRDLAFFLAPSFFMMGALAVLAAAWLAVRGAAREGFDRRVLLGALMALYVGIIAAGIVVPMLVDAGQRFLAGRGLALRWAGMVSFAGYAGGLLAAYLVIRRSRASWPAFLDVMAAPAALGLCFARLGCFVAGCDFGKVTDAAWAVRFPGGSPAWHAHVNAGLVPGLRDASLPVHPTQVYESLLGLALCLIALYVLPRLRLPAGGRFYAVGGLYALGRAGIETLRGDSSRGVFEFVSTGQILSALILAVVAFLLVRGRRRMLTVPAVLALLALAPVDAHADWSLGGELGTASPINRRENQVPGLAGGRFALGYDLEKNFAVVVSFDSLANDLARHNSLLLGARAQRPLSGKLAVGIGLHFGYTFVNFLEPSFEDVPGTSLRLWGGIDWLASPRWTFTVSPIGFDYLMASDLGGPILSYQLSIGLTYRFGSSQTASNVPPSPPAQPMQPMQPLPQLPTPPPAQPQQPSPFPVFPTPPPG